MSSPRESKYDDEVNSAYCPVHYTPFSSKNPDHQAIRLIDGTSVSRKAYNDIVNSGNLLCPSSRIPFVAQANPDRNLYLESLSETYIKQQEQIQKIPILEDTIAIADRSMKVKDEELASLHTDFSRMEQEIIELRREVEEQRKQLELSKVSASRMMRMQTSLKSLKDENAELREEIARLKRDQSRVLLQSVLNLNSPHPHHSRSSSNSPAQSPNLSPLGSPLSSSPVPTHRSVPSFTLSSSPTGETVMRLASDESQSPVSSSPNGDAKRETRFPEIQSFLGRDAKSTPAVDIPRNHENINKALNDKRKAQKGLLPRQGHFKKKSVKREIDELNAAVNRIAAPLG